MMGWARIKLIFASLLAVSLVSITVADEKAEPKADAKKIAKQAELDKLVAEAVRITSRRFLTADIHTPWQIMHGILALRKDFQIKVDGKRVSALEWLEKGQTFRDLSIIEKSEHGGRFHRFTKPYHFEGHPNQFLAILTMSELPTDFSLKTSKGQKVSIADMLENAKMTVNDREEITWTLWSLARYLPIDSEWVNNANEPWSIERLVQIQTYAEPNDAACGGTHGLFALSIARNAYVFSGRPLRGIWMEAEQKIRRYVAEAKALQNSDGTFSTVYFTGPGHSKEFGKRIASTGHILEFLMVALSDKQLEQEWVQRAIRAVAKDLVDHKRDAADCGPLYHALHALVLYQQRTKQHVVAKPATPDRIATKTKDTSANPPSDSTESDSDGDAAVPVPKKDRTDGIRSGNVPVQPRAPRRNPARDDSGSDSASNSTKNDGVTTLRELLDGAEIEADESANRSTSQTSSQTITQVVARTPEENAAQIPTQTVLEDGHKIPQPPTLD